MFKSLFSEAEISLGKKPPHMIGSILILPEVVKDG